MTPEQARAFIEEAETKQLENIDTDALGEALRVLAEASQGQSIIENDILLRARALAQRVNLLPSFGQGQITTESGERVDVPQMDSTFTRRLFEAAEGAGVPEPEVQAVVSQATQMAAQSGGQFSVEFLLQPQLEEWETQAAAQRGRPIGVPDDFVAQPTFELDPADRKFAGGAPTTTIPVEPRYFEGDEFSPAGLGPTQIASIQKRLEDAGLLDPGGYWSGFWDGGTASAYKQALGMANSSGHNIDTTLEEMARTLPESIKEQRARAEASKVFQAPPFIAPDYASLAQDVKGFFRSRVGRDPSADELSELTSTMSGLYRQQHEAEVSAMRAQFEAGQATTETAPPTIQGVDPTARFREIFDQRFGPEVDRFESLDDVRNNMSNVFASLRTMSSLVGR